MQTPRFSKTEVDTVPRLKPKEFEPQSADGVDFSGCCDFGCARHVCGSAYYNRSFRSLWSLGDCTWNAFVSCLVVTNVRLAPIRR